MASLKNAGFPGAGLEKGAASTGQIYTPGPPMRGAASQAEGFTVGSGQRLTLTTMFRLYIPPETVLIRSQELLSITPNSIILEKHS